MFPWGKVAVSVTLCTKVHLPREDIGLGLITFRMFARWRKIRVECRMAGKPLVKGNKWRCITELSFDLCRSALQKDRPMLGRNNWSAGLPDAPLDLFSYIHAHFSAHSTAMIKICKNYISAQGTIYQNILEWTSTMRDAKLVCKSWLKYFPLDAANVYNRLFLKYFSFLPLYRPSSVFKVPNHLNRNIFREKLWV